MTAFQASGRRLLTEPLAVGRLTLPPLGIVVLATVGSVLLLVTAVTRWGTPSDEHAYWLAARRLVDGLSLYDLGSPVGTPYAYWYPPPLAQVLVPVAVVLPAMAFTLAWTGVLLGCLVYLADRRLIVALAMVAFVPVAIELWFRNIHLVLALLVVLALRRHVLFWVPAAAIKITPVLGVAYLIAGRRYRDATLVTAVGVALLAASMVVSPGAWDQFLELVTMQGASSGASLVPVPFPIRFALAAALAVIGGRIGGRRGEACLIVALVVGNPTLWMTAFSLLVAIVPLWRRQAPPPQAVEHA